MTEPTRKQPDRSNRSAETAHASAAARYLTPKQAAVYLSVKPKQLERLRMTGDGPAFSKVGRLVRYSRADLDAYMATNRVRNTAEVARG